MKLLLTFCAIVAASASVAHATKHHVWVLGDSISDTGNFQQQLLERAMPGVDTDEFESALPFYSGSFTNSPGNWVDQLDAKRNFNVRSFAYGGAMLNSTRMLSTFCDATGAPPGSGCEIAIPSIFDQLEEAIEARKSCDHLAPDAIVVQVGANDVIEGLKTATSPQDFQSIGYRFAMAYATLVGQIAVQFPESQLYVMDMITYVTPFERALLANPQTAPAAFAARSLGEAFNGAIQQIAATSQGNITFFSMNEAASKVFESRRLLKEVPCGGDTSKCTFLSCPDYCGDDEVDNYLFMDDVHPSSRVHKQIAKHFAKVVKKN